MSSMCDAGCSCKQNSIECTGLRTPEANPKTCKNVQHLNIDDIEIIFTNNVLLSVLNIHTQYT